MAQVMMRNLSKTFGKANLILSGVDLEIEKGEFLVVVGPSGSGKSTLLRLVAGLEEVTQGEVFIAGKFVNDLPPLERDIAMVFQDYALYPHMTVLENVSFGLKMRKISSVEIV